MDALEAERKGLVSKVVPADQLLEEVVKVADKIASNSKLINQVITVGSEIWKPNLLKTDQNGRQLTGATTLRSMTLRLGT